MPVPLKGSVKRFANTTWAATGVGRAEIYKAAAVICISALLLFFRLGHYALWDDEAGLAIRARGVWQTGDTSIVAGHNILAPRQGIIVRDLKDRANPPLPAYVMAPFAAFSGTGAFLPRLPLALCGLMCVGLLLWWLWRDKADRMTWSLMAIAILGNVSFFLYFRQARYYGITLLCSVAAAYLLLITDLYDHNWHAEALPDSTQQSYHLMPADYVLRAVPLAAGHHHLQMVYAPTALPIGIGISVAAWALWIGLLIWDWRRKNLEKIST